VARRAGQPFRQVQLVINEHFHVHACQPRVTEENLQWRLSIPCLISGNLGVSNDVLGIQPPQKFGLRKLECNPNLSEFVGKTLRLSARVSHQELPPDGMRVREKSLPLLPAGNKIWLRNCFAVSRDLSCSTAMLISEGELRFASDPLSHFQRLERARIAHEHFGWRLVLARLRARLCRSPGDPRRGTGAACASAGVRAVSYNFCRIHSTIHCTPAMKAGITKSLWTLKDLLKAT
jgi:hypothetical protein